MVAVPGCFRMVLRKILRIDEERCNGCGLCIPACAEGALQIVDGKVRLVGEKYCDGLGACIGECPNGAISIETREAEQFDEEDVTEQMRIYDTAKADGTVCSTHQQCPSARVVQFNRSQTSQETAGSPESRKSAFSQWPVQLALIPTDAPFFENADLVVAADCVPFAHANFHREFLEGKTLVIGCPKLDNAELYKEKLTEIFKRFNIRSINVVNMEVPCCFGLYSLVKKAVDSSGKEVPLHQEIVTLKGSRATPRHKARSLQVGLTTKSAFQR
jgi:NAD-dependent dihydropyrimidine dehydrogenase PreA subunit